MNIDLRRLSSLRKYSFLPWDAFAFQAPEEETLSQAPQNEEEQKRVALERSM